MSACPHAWYTALPEDKLIPGFRFCRLCNKVAWESLVEMVEAHWNVSLLPQGVVVLKGPYPPHTWVAQGDALRPVFPYKLTTNLAIVPEEGLEAFYGAMAGRLTTCKPLMEFRCNN